MARDPRLVELGKFLRARRSEVRPSEVGLETPDAYRRVPGLRREEVARLAIISADYYTRIEQGRIVASAPVLGDLARVLQLTDDQRAYVFNLIGRPQPSTVPRPATEHHLQRLLDDLQTTPAFVLGRCTDILAWNAMAAALITDFGQIPAPERQFLRLLITNAAMHDLYDDWEGVTRLAIAQLRMDAVRYPDDPRLAALVTEWAQLDASFAAWWDERDATFRGSGVKTLHHPLVGDLTLDWDTLTSATDPDQQVVVWTAEPGSASRERLLALSSIQNSAEVRSLSR